MLRFQVVPLLFRGAPHPPGSFSAPGAGSAPGAPPIARAWRVGFLVGLALCTCAAGTRAAPLFGSAFEPLDSPPSQWSQLCYLNGDREADLMGLCSTNSNWCVFTRLGLADGAFRPPHTYPAPGALVGPLIADADGDGRPDLLAGVSGQSQVMIWLSNPDGTLQPPKTLNTLTTPYVMRVGDVNNDGLLDLVAIHGSPRFTLTTYMGLGGGTFGAPVSTTLNNTYANGLALGNLNNDTKLDAVVTVSSSPSVWLMYGNGNGTFGLNAELATAPSPTDVAIADLDWNGRMDIVAVGSSTQMANAMTTVLMAGTSGGYTRTDYYMGVGCRGLLVTDLDGNGFPDLAVVNQFGHQVSIRFGQPTGGFSGRPIFGGPTVVLSAADVDHDGRMDLWCERGLLRQTAYRVFGQANAVECGLAAQAVAAGDLNDDGIPDVVVANRNPGTVSVLLGRPGPSLGSRTTFPMGTFPYDVALADLNDDGHLDLIVADTGGHAVKLRLGDGTGGFGAVTSIPVGGLPFAIAVSDINGDGFLDVVAVGDEASGNTLFTLLGHGDGTFDPVVPGRAGNAPRHIELGLIDDDDLPDLVTTSYYIYVALNQGDGSFGPPVQLGSGVIDAALGDVDGDGHVDIVAAGPIRGAGTLYFFHALGGGAFAPPTSWAMNGSGPATDCAVADLDGDGNLDVVAVMGDLNFPSDLVGVRIGKGDGTFGPALLFGTEDAPTDLALADFDGDGHPELVVPNYVSGRVIIMGNQADRVVGAPIKDSPTLSGFEARPNPAGEQVQFRFAMIRPGHARLALHDLQGRRIATPLDGAMDAGTHEVRWNLNDGGGMRVRAGVYFAELSTPAGRSVRRVVVIE